MSGQLPVEVRVGAQAYTVAPGEEFAFGRSRECTVCLDPDDATISRRAGVITSENGIWFVVNTSTRRGLELVDDRGLRSLVGPGKRSVLQGSMRVYVQGGGSRPHIVEIDAHEFDSAGLRELPTGQPTITGDDVVLTREEKLALTALFAGYLQKGAAYDPYPRTYDAAAKRLGWPRTTLLRKIEYLRTRLTKAGVPNMNGANALINLAEHALTRGLITEHDLRLIGL
ncbi:hypothetical protein FHS29_005213 [Saccharothrix tamanrassetensis]|uniref:FHA domain-containing protein n=1 Tax=Saccharothrix tamanrassetensis TaxID=1051531 RepID=A0A841CRK6_9PSEU|nr:hypothetical protein [Saccharothrix tamanrassetensis]MBB5958605.1 hypothetical protein [Saccharothrix tamanrassetensis]